MQYPRRKKTSAQAATLMGIRILFGCVAAFMLYRCFSHPPQIKDTSTVPAVISQAEAEPSSQESSPSTELPPTAPVRQRRENVFNILVIGLDNENGGSDTNLLVSLDVPQERVSVVSLPRDTLLNTSWQVKKLNNAYYNGGVSSVQAQVSHLLGVPVDFYVVVDLKGFVKLIDAVGGVEFNVPVDMDYDDPYQDLYIHIPKGLQLLDGESAMKVVRWRKNNDGTEYATRDIGRIGTQQQFLKAAARQILKPAQLDKLPQMVEIFSESVETDLSVPNLIWLGEQVLRMGADSITFHTLPGDGAGYYKGISYYTVDPIATLELVNTYLNPYDAEVFADELDILVP